MPSAALLPPRLNPPYLPRDLETVLEASASPALRGEHQMQLFSALDAETDASYATIAECAFTPADVRSLTLRGARLTDVAFADLSAVHVAAREASLRNVRLEGGRIASLDLSGGELASVELRGMRIDYLSLSAATISDVVLVDCRIGSLDMPEAVIDRMAFESSTADEVDTRSTRTHHLDLRGLDVGRFLDAASLQGATLSEDQVMRHSAQLAAALGILVA